MKRSLVILALLSAAHAQAPPTAVPNRALRGEASGVVQVRLTLQNGDVVDADIDTGTFEVVIQPNGKPLLRGTAVAAQRVYGQIAAADSQDTSGRTFVLSRPAGNVAVFRDGLRMAETVDYEIMDPSTIRFTSYYTGGAASRVLIDYEPAG